jgi:glycosyltransferase involved in cell wall biosynthesis
VLVDARGLLTSGIGRYLRGVVAAILADPRVSGVKLLGEPASLRDFARSAAGGHKAAVVPYDHGFYSPAAQAAWLALRARGIADADVAFFPHYDAPCLAMPARSVLTVHDLIHFKVPEAFAAWRRAAAGVLLHRGVTAAARVIAVSDATRRDLVERIPSAAGKVVVVPNGVTRFFGEGAGGGPSVGAGIGGPYLLCVGNRKPHKNLEGAVETLARLAAARPELRLVVVGEVYPGWSAVLERAEALGVRGRIVELSGVDDARLRALYAGCEALLFLSLYEGFGLPVLEAMAAGAPVVASDRSSIPEVVGDAGLLVDPRDPAAAAAAVLRLAADPAFRAERVRRGRARAAQFTWERAGRETADILNRVAAQRPAPRGSTVLEP